MASVSVPLAAVRVICTLAPPGRRRRKTLDFRRWAEDPSAISHDRLGGRNDVDRRIVDRRDIDGAHLRGTQAIPSLATNVTVRASVLGLSLVLLYLTLRNAV